MAMYDWNGNGDRNDMVDNFVEYQIFMDSAGDTGIPSSTNTWGSGFWLVFVIAGIVAAFNELLGALILLGYIFMKSMGM